MTAAILAGGRATRLDGRNKAGLRIGNRTILARQLAMLKDVVDRTIIIASDSAPYLGYNVPVIPDLVPGIGSLGGIYTALHAAGTEQTLVIACDMPFLTRAFLSHLIDVGRYVDIAIPRTQRGYEALCATYSQRCIELLRRQIDAAQLKACDLMAQAGELSIRELGCAELAKYNLRNQLFANINTPEDYASALENCEECETSPPRDFPPATDI